MPCMNAVRTIYTQNNFEVYYYFVSNTWPSIMRLSRPACGTHTRGSIWFCLQRANWIYIVLCEHKWIYITAQGTHYYILLIVIIRYLWMVIESESIVGSIDRLCSSLNGVNRMRKSECVCVCFPFFLFFFFFCSNLFVNKFHSPVYCRDLCLLFIWPSVSVRSNGHWRRHHLS